MFLCLFLLIAISIIAPTNGYKILVYSSSVSNSHLISNARVADVLANDGHDVTLLEVEMMAPLVKNFSKKAKVLRVFGRFFGSDGFDFQKVLAFHAFRRENIRTIYQMNEKFQREGNNACEKFITSNPDLIESLRKQKFDVVIEEQLNFCGAGLGHLLAIPIHILISSCPLQEHVASLFGLPFPFSYLPSLMNADLPDKMSLFERFDNFLRTFVGYVYLWHGIDPLTNIFRKHFGNDFPDLRDIVKNSPLVFISVDELLDFPRPLFPNMVNIGGIGMDKLDKNAKLEEPFKSEMSKGKEGVVFVSMGTIIRSSDLPAEFRRNLLETFAKFSDYHFVMRIEKGDNYSAEIAAKFGNIFLTPWAPQPAILADPRLKLFITHGGYNSLLEATRGGVPVLAMGFFADQHRNTRAAERNGWARSFEKLKLVEGTTEFETLLGEMLNNEKYAVGAKRIQNLMSTKPFPAEERLTKSIRFLEQNGGKLPELLSESRNMGTISLYNIDLALIGIFFIFFFLLVFVRSFAFFLHLSLLPSKIGPPQKSSVGQISAPRLHNCAGAELIDKLGIHGDEQQRKQQGDEEATENGEKVAAHFEG
ncbi:hypothetical protein niasHT_016911 [Heterodera trifolii]|uniref:glucuronosyltransferase n=1 Tax=Heterodera trifolii TaxID=157864 RepID=A0ABD2KV99_9BILA